MENYKFKNALRFYLLATELKYKIRSGWDKNHWNITSERIESIAEHVYGTCILAISLDSEFNFEINLDKILKMLILHEIGEVIIGDITPFSNITPKEKEAKEHEAIIKIVGNLINKDEIISLLFEFDEKKTKEAIFAYYCDKLEADIQSKVYQDKGYHNSLDNQLNNKVFKNEKAKKIVKNGAKTAFDIWYEWDKSIYSDNEIFTKMLELIRTTNTQEDYNF